MWRAPGICCWAFTIPYIYINDIVKASDFNTVLYADCGSPLLKEENYYTFRTIPREHWSIGMSMARPS